MKVYVDELPKSCEECPCYSYSEGFCNCEFWWQKYKEIKDVQEYTHLGYKQNERPNDCPLQSLADYTKQVRKETEKLQNDWNKLKDWTKSDGFIHLTPVKQIFLEKMAKIEKGE